MSKKKPKHKTKRDTQWAEAKRLCRLNVETMRMAKELGMDPRSLIKNRPSPSQQWKAPVHVWIRDLYERMQEKAARKRARRAQAQSADADGSIAEPPATPKSRDDIATTPAPHPENALDHLVDCVADEMEYTRRRIWDADDPSRTNVPF